MSNSEWRFGHRIEVHEVEGLSSRNEFREIRLFKQNLVSNERVPSYIGYLTEKEIGHRRLHKMCFFGAIIFDDDNPICYRQPEPIRIKVVDSISRPELIAMKYSGGEWVEFEGVPGIVHASSANGYLREAGKPSLLHVFP